MFSRPSLLLFQHLLLGVQLDAAADDFERVAGEVVTAKKELAEALEASTAVTPTRSARRAPRTH